ncbi:MAG: hypothetical protein AAF799_45090 [Myxococcota bacterium]
MKLRALAILLPLGTACGPSTAPEGSAEGSTGELGDDSSGAPGADTTGDEADADSGSDDGSTGEPPLPCANLDPAPGDTCYVEHLIEMRVEIAALSDQNGDGRLDLLLAQGFRCCEEDEDEPEPTGLWLLPGNDDGSLGEPQLLFETPDHFEWLRPMGPGPDGIPRVMTRRRVDVGFLVVHEYAVLAGEQFIEEPLPLPLLGDNEVGVADLDGDGVLDLAAMDGDAYFALSGPQGSFQITQHEMGQGSFLTVLVGDDDDDGVDDMLLVDDDPRYPGRPFPSDFIGQWSHTQPGPEPTLVPGPANWTLSVGANLRLGGARLLDLDGDGRLDLWTRHREYVPSANSSVQRQLVVALGTEDGFAPQVDTDLETTVLTMEPLLAPLDGSLRAVVHVVDHPDELWLMMLSDSLEFGIGTRLGLSYPTPDNSSDIVVHVGDLNGDGHSDFVTRVGSDPQRTGAAVLLSRPESP